MTNKDLENEILTQLKGKQIYSICLSDDTDKQIYIKDFADDLYLRINQEWFNNNNSEYEKFMIEFINQYNDSKISFKEGSLINEKIIDAICANENIKEVSVAQVEKEDTYILTEKDYKKFKEAKKECIITSGVSDELKEIFDPMIYYNKHTKLIGNNTYDKLQSSEFRVDFKLSPEELENLKFISDNTVIIVGSNSNLLDISDKLKELNKNNIIKLEIKYDTRNQELATMGFFDENWNVKLNPDDNIYISKNLKLNTYLRCESLLYTIAREAEHLSPVEKYLYIYDIVKHFKKYNTPGKDNKNATLDEENTSENKLSKEEVLEIKSRSRDLYQILDNDYIVCVGFTNLLVNLLDKVGLESCQDTVSIELSDRKAISQLENKYENWNELSPLEKNNLVMQQKVFIPHDSYEGHSRIMVRIDDPKYGINGLYFADPTWDNNIKKNSYAHAFMTAETVLQSKSSMKFECEDIFLYASNLEQFKEMFSTGLKKYIEKVRLEEYEDDKARKGYKSVDDVHLNIKKTITKYIRTICLGSIKPLFNDEYNLLIEKYPFVLQFDVDKWPFKSETELGTEINDLLNEYGKFIVTKNNNVISKDTLESILKEVYKGVFFEPLSQENIDAYNANPNDIELNNKVYQSEVKQEIIDEFIKDTNDIEEYEYGEVRTR